MTSQRMNPRARSVWTAAAASSAVSPRSSVQARASLSPAVKNVIRSAASKASPEDSLERRRPLAVLGRLLGGQLGQLGLEFQIDPARPVLEHDERLRGQRLELPAAAAAHTTDSDSPTSR